MESFPSRGLAEMRFGSVTEERNSSSTLVLFRKTCSYILFLNEEVYIIGILYFFLRKKKKIHVRFQFGSNHLGQRDKKYLSRL